MPSARLRDPPRSSVGTVLLLGVIVATAAFVGVAVADDHTRDEASHYGHDEEGNATFEFLQQEDHHPGAENVSVRYTLKGGEVFEDVGATDGIAADRFVVDTDAVDHSDCDTENVATFAIDRGDDGSDGEWDQDLLRHTRQAYYFEDSVVVEFYDYDDFGGDPPVVRAEDRIVLELSDGAAGGGCADTTEEVGFYRAEAFLNGTGPMEQDREDETYGFTVESDYTYVCECEDEEEARERIGPPPGPHTPTGTASGTDTPTATPTPTATATPTDRPRTPTPDGTPILTATVNESVGDRSVSANASVDGDGVSADASVAGAGGDDADRAAVDPPSPTPGDAPGFGAGVAALTLVGSWMVARRRLS